MSWEKLRKVVSVFSTNWKIFSVLSKMRKILSTFSNLAQGKYEKSDEEKLEKNFRTFRVFRAVRVFALALLPLAVEMCVEIWQCCHTVKNTIRICLSKDDALILLLSSDAN